VIRLPENHVNSEGSMSVRITPRITHKGKAITMNDVYFDIAVISMLMQMNKNTGKILSSQTKFVFDFTFSLSVK
jgi:hypothetical protein